MCTYKPISPKHYHWKIVEKLIKKILSSYLEKHEVVSKFQFGFKSNVCAEDAVTNY